jgi:hypothetical protein
LYEKQRLPGGFAVARSQDFMLQNRLERQTFFPIEIGEHKELVDFLINLARQLDVSLKVPILFTVQKEWVDETFAKEIARGIKDSLRPFGVEIDRSLVYAGSICIESFVDLNTASHLDAQMASDDGTILETLRKHNVSSVQIGNSSYRIDNRVEIEDVAASQVSTPAIEAFEAWIAEQIEDILQENQSFCQAIATIYETSNDATTVTELLTQKRFAAVWQRLEGQLRKLNDHLTDVRRLLFALAQAECKGELVNEIRGHLESGGTPGLFSIPIQTRYEILGELVLSTALKQNVSIENHLGEHLIKPRTETGLDSERTRIDVAKQLMQRLNMLHQKDPTDDEVRVLLDDLKGELETFYLSNRPFYASHSGLEALKIPYLFEFLIVKSNKENTEENKDLRSMTRKNDALMYEVVNNRTEVTDLLYQFDAVSRLADAQILGASGADKDEVKQILAPDRYVRPGRIWWAMNWESARQQVEISGSSVLSGSSAPSAPADGWRNGCVLLVDEIDKADSELPNALLECFANQSFQVPNVRTPVARKREQPAPLVVVTTNEERELPGPFLRRCLVLKLSLSRDPKVLKAFLIKRGKVHFDEKYKRVEGYDAILSGAADLLIQDRERLGTGVICRPGQAEYLDLCRAVFEIAKEPGCGPATDIMKAVADFTLQKNANR